MSHPLEFLPARVRRPFFVFFFILTAVILGVFSTLDEHLKNDLAPRGTVSFEFAGNVQSAQDMVNSWSAESQLYMAFGLGFDYLFMPVYAVTLALGLLLVRGENPSRWTAFVNLMGWGAFAAALFDATENYALWHTLMHGAATPYPQIAAVCATIKFGLLIVGIIISVAGKILQR